MRDRFRLLAAAWCSCSPLISLAELPYPETITVKDALSVPLLSGPVASADGQQIAWAEEIEGRRNLWVATAPAKGAHVTAFNDDDGMRISEISFLHGINGVVFRRGGNINNRGETYNPLSRPDPVENEWWFVDLETRQARRIGEGNRTAPVLGPDDRLYYGRGGEVWVQAIPDGKPKRLFTVRGTITSLVPSPDGDKLAFVSDRRRYRRGSYSFVGIFDRDDRSITYVFPSIEADQEPTWSPDGSKIAFLRIPVIPKSYRFSDLRDVVPWSIVVGDPETGEGRVIWTADRGLGSSFQPVEGRSLIWLGDDLIFPWEKTDWNLLYKIPAEGGAATLLTPGDHEVLFVDADTNTPSVVYASNLHDIERWHLWQVDLADGTPRQLTSGLGVERQFAVMKQGKVAYLAEFPTAAPRIETISPAGEEVAVLTPERDTRVTEQFIESEIVQFKAPDGERIYGHLYRPKGTLSPGEHPVLVYAHGGCHNRIDPVYRAHFIEGAFQYVLSRGYIVFSVNFRSGTGRGLSFREPPAYGGRGSEEIQDFVGAAEYLARLPEVDPKAISIAGHSCGGHIVTNVLARHSDLYAAGISYAGVGDWRVEMEMDSEEVLPFRISRRMELEDLAFESSGVAHLESWTSPILFIHGDDDLQAAMWPTIEMTLELRRRDVPAETLIFPGEGHFYFVHDNERRLVERVWQFLEKYGQAISDP